MEVRIIEDRQQWNEFVIASLDCHITQSYEWGELAHHLHHSQALRVGVIDETGKLCAAMLILISCAPLLHRTYFYAPRGPIIADPGSPALTLLLNFVKAEAYKWGAFMLKIEPAALDGDTRWLLALKRRGFQVNPYASHVRHEWILDLRPAESELLAGMKEKWRYNIRLATRKGITISRSESQEALDTFYHLYQITSRRDQFFIHQKEYYVDLVRHFSIDQRVAVFLAEFEGQVISSIIVLTLGRWSWYMFGASSNEHRERMPNHLLQWTALQWAKAQGCWYYDFRGIPDILEEGQELWGVYLFKRGFGGYPMRFLATHDLVYQPLVYETYRRLLEVKRWHDGGGHTKIIEQAFKLVKQ